jgi:hypothetical protein
MAKPMQTVMANLNSLTKDTRLYPRGRFLATLLKIALNPKMDKRARDLAEAVILHTFIRKGGIDISEDLPTNLADKAPHTRLELEASSSMKDLLKDLISGGGNGQADSGSTTGSTSQEM